MSTIINKTKVKCYNDCVPQGCPGHLVELHIQTVSDSITFYKDGKILIDFDPDLLNSFLHMVKLSEYYVPIDRIIKEVFTNKQND